MTLSCMIDRMIKLKYTFYLFTFAVQALQALIDMTEESTNNLAQDLRAMQKALKEEKKKVLLLRVTTSRLNNPVSFHFS